MTRWLAENIFKRQYSNSEDDHHSSDCSTVSVSGAIKQGHLSTPLKITLLFVMVFVDLAEKVPLNWSVRQEVTGNVCLRWATFGANQIPCR